MTAPRPRPFVRSVKVERPKIPWSPINMGSNLLAWYEGDGIDQADDSTVASWPDLSGRGRHATQATGAAKPTFQTNELNSKPVLRFDGIDDGLATSAIDWGILYGDYTLAFVVKTPATFTDNRALMQISSWQPIIYFPIDGTVYWFHNSAVNFAKVLTVDTWYTIVISRIGTNINMWWNGTVDTVTGTPATHEQVPPEPLRIGATEQVGTSWFESDLAAALITNHTSATDRVEIEAYWRSKYAHY